MKRFPTDKSILDYDISPWIQGVVVLATMVFFMIVAKVGDLTGIITRDPETPFLIACSMSFFFVMGNTVLSISTSDQNAYWWKSMVCYIVLALLGSVIGYVFSGVNMDYLGSYRWLFIMFAVAHVIFLAIARTMRKLVKIAQKEDSRLRGEK